MDLSGKVAIVTGVSKGIGRATAELLLERGATVAGWSRSAPTGLAHERFHFVACDVSREESVQQALAATQQAVGPEVHVLINNAGLGIMGAVDGFAADDWCTMFDTNVHGTFYCARAVLPKMKRQQLGHILNVASLAGTVGSENMAGYCATKFAVRGFSEALFKEVRQFGIKVTCLNPGSVETSFNGKTPGATPTLGKLQAEDVAAVIVHTLEAPFHVLISELDMRPLQPGK
ncbi:SDR family NAD(P)-dependent oxidoreductase [Hymenobacter sp. J193]|uniref:SDR family oxidoreductase n=1 Tax=Hymenobacter sp. J193 TaxID=2898429 RepID=UPI00215113A5|nr:SDR family NAD(P)-dependent oxidoreductase [Hymenobacter sp. J193]MCR5889594.1 SDR family NAD(P)-dependent oxidoreductase [Hymenobacter sp. J193]